MPKPTVSYVVTLFNKAPYLPYLLAGLASQNGDFDKQYIFVDDGSTDDTVSILRKMISDWKNCIVLQQNNTGPAVALNKGFSVATGDFFKPVDGDDMLVPWATTTLLEALGNTGCDVAYANMRFQEKYQIGQMPDYYFEESPKNILNYEKEFNFIKKSLTCAQTNPTSWLAKREIVQAVAGCDEGVFVQDYSLELKLAATAEIVRLDRCLFLAPAEAPGRLSDSEAQTLHDVNLAVTRFLRHNPHLPRDIKKYGMRRVASRAWKWARRHDKKTFLSKEFALSILTRCYLLEADTLFENAVCTPFMKSAIRLMDGNLKT
jgi:hypothetical protein